jgi:hypothetical protein
MKRIMIAMCLCLPLVAGCSLFRDPCGAVMPVVVASQSRLADVQRALSEVERSGVRELLTSAEARRTFDDAMSRAWAAYEVAVQSTALASESCSHPSLAALFEEIVEAWGVIRSFLGLFGGMTTVGAVSDPIVWTEAQR